MRIRLRFFAALLALLALSTSMVQQSWAAACVGMDGSHSSAVVASESGPSQASIVHDAPDPGEHRSHSPPDGPSCPMAAGAGMVCSVIALPVDASLAPFGSEVHSVVLPAADEAPGSLALSSLFRPPRR